jgi:hypothetical protein
MSIINTFTGPAYVSLPDAPATGTVKLLQLDHSVGSQATINTTQGSFFMDPSMSNLALMYTGNPYWSSLDRHNTSMFPTHLTNSFTASATSTTGTFFSCALSAKGDTLLIGNLSITNNSTGGAGIVYSYTGGTWVEQAMLFPPAYISQDSGGFAVALSADGNIAALGDPEYNSDLGRVIIFNRNGTTWLFTTVISAPDVISVPFQGSSVALSADGTVLVFGGSGDNSSIGAAWVYKNNGGIWIEVQKLIGNTIALGSTPYQGSSVAVSSDGTVIAVLGDADGPNNGVYGAIWVWVNKNGTYIQQAKLTSSDGNGQYGVPFGGFPIPRNMCLSAKGDVIAVGNTVYSSNSIATGGIDIFQNNNGIWSQQGSILIGTDYTSPGSSTFPSNNQGQGSTVALSTDGNTLVFGSYYNPLISPGVYRPEPTWVFTRDSYTNVWKQQYVFTYPTTTSLFYKNFGLALSSLADVMVTTNGAQSYISTVNNSVYTYT